MLQAIISITLSILVLRFFTTRIGNVKQLHKIIETQHQQITTLRDEKVGAIITDVQHMQQHDKTLHTLISVSHSHLISVSHSQELNLAIIEDLMKKEDQYKRFIEKLLFRGDFGYDDEVKLKAEYEELS